jgi:hypothetical protein
LYTWLDYALITSILFASAFSGVYFGFLITKQSTTNEYLRGERIMKTILIAILAGLYYTDCCINNCILRKVGTYYQLRRLLHLSKLLSNTSSNYVIQLVSVLVNLTINYAKKSPIYTRTR